ncbi:dnaJ homolog subfamily C member 1 [Erythrolamprus reginae]|uniref:dnaJ homolog subfamily C member 1 n=1 Tax=Erythrolamprus reginae TaxID=121349 RepID=UPI00396C8DD3
MRGNSHGALGCRARPWTGSPWLQLLALGLLVPFAFAWESGDLELFDLVEEVPQNFYAFLGVEQDAPSADIRKAYRKLSLILHPDKNKDENAETQFRQLVAIYEVLKDEERRHRYDDILINGLPDWRQPVFYYRRVRKMSNEELALLLFIILTVGHYAVVWSIYLEKQLDELLSRKKKEKKKRSGGKNSDEMKLGVEKSERQVEKPQWRDLLPFKVGIWFYTTVKALPQLFQEAKQLYVEYKETKIKEKEEALARAELETLQKEKKPKVKKPKSEFPVYAVTETNAYIPSYDHGTSIEEIEDQMDDWLEGRNKSLKKRAPEWMEEDLSQLTRSMVKFPGGTPGRWEKIAHELGRSVADVTTKAKQIKDSVSSVAGTIKFSELKTLAQSSKSSKANISLPDLIITQRDKEDDQEEKTKYSYDPETINKMTTDEQDTGLNEARHRKRKAIPKASETIFPGTKEITEDKCRGKRQKDFDTAEQEEYSDDEAKKKERCRSSDDFWTQNQQKLLELALQQYPKGTLERWDKIAKCVPGKSKEECMTRYKLLVELIQKKKMAQS